jgi:hypothetical protein
MISSDVSSLIRDAYWHECAEGISVDRAVGK